MLGEEKKPLGNIGSYVVTFIWYTRGFTRYRICVSTNAFPLSFEKQIVWLDGHLLFLTSSGNTVSFGTKTRHFTDSQQIFVISNTDIRYVLFIFIIHGNDRVTPEYSNFSTRGFTDLLDTNYGLVYDVMVHELINRKYSRYFPPPSNSMHHISDEKMHGRILLSEYLWVLILSIHK